MFLWMHCMVQSSVMNFTWSFPWRLRNWSSGSELQLWRFILAHMGPSVWSPFLVSNFVVHCIEWAVACLVNWGHFGWHRWLASRSQKDIRQLPEKTPQSHQEVFEVWDHQTIQMQKNWQDQVCPVPTLCVWHVYGNCTNCACSARYFALDIAYIIWWWLR